jgi:hypothetical protein
LLPKILFLLANLVIKPSECLLCTFTIDRRYVNVEDAAQRVRRVLFNLYVSILSLSKPFVDAELKERGPLKYFV